jgi:bifunctional oligoribonuclease and PAP phosphatase NrnA
VKGGVDILALKGHLKGNISIICHHNADPDAIGAAYAMKRLIETINPEAVTELLYPDTASQLSGKIMAHYSIEASNQQRTSADTVVVVDTGSLIQLENLRPLVEEANVRIFIDHHGRDAEIERLATLYISDEEATATCEIITDLWRAYGLEPPREVAEVLFLGILFDSKHFGIGSPHLLRTAAHLMDLGATLSGAKELLQGTLDQSERIARLKSAQRLTIHRIGPWLIASSNLSSFQASAARGLIGLGADVAILAGNDKNEIKASIRSTEDFRATTGIHLGDDVAKPLAESFSGAGGGHPTAAGVNGVGDSEVFLKKAIDYLTGKIGGLHQVL